MKNENTTRLLLSVVTGASNSRATKRGPTSIPHVGGVMKRLVLLSCVVVLAALVVSPTFAQVSGTKNIPGDYADLASAIADVNTNGVGAGGATLNLLAGSPQTAPLGGYVIGGPGSLVLTTTSAANPLVLQGNGNTITAFTPQTAGSTSDAIFKLVGADWTTITGFTMAENGGNVVLTPVGSNTMTEWGVALLYAATTDGAQNNTIQSNTITLNRAYNNSFGIYSNTRHAPGTPGTNVDATTAAGANSNNKAYGNNISNVNFGIVFIGSGATAVLDTGNDIGGGSAPTGNIITDWGGQTATAATFVSMLTSNVGIYVTQQINDNISFNTITSASIATGATGLGGIIKLYATSPTAGTVTTTNINNNTVTLTDAATTAQLTALGAQGMTANSAATINMNNNSILNCAITGAATSATFVGILNVSAAGTMNVNGNTIRGTTSTATTGGFVGIQHQTNAVINVLNVNNNHIGDATAPAVNFATAANSGVVTGLAVTSTGAAATCATSISSNDFRGITYTTSGTGAHTYIINSSASLSQNISSNTFTNLNVNTSGSVTFISNSVTVSATGTQTVNSNSIVTAFNKGGSGGTVTFYTTNASSVAGAVVNNNNNNFSNVTVTGTTAITGWSNTDGGTVNKTISGNTFSNITGGTGAASMVICSFGGGGGGAGNVVTGNTVSNVSGGGTVTGITIGSSGTTHTAASNTVSGLTSSGASSTVTGMIVSGGTTVTSSGNTISGILGTGTTSPVANGHTVSGGTTVTVSKNKIYDVSQSAAITTTAPAVNGILISGGTTVTTVNNLVGDLRAPLASLTDAIRGISITSTTTSSTQNVSYNSVYLNASSTGANFGTTGIFHTTSTTATTATLNLRNSIVDNLSTPNGTGLTVAYRRSSGAANTLSNYGVVSNSNDLHAGTPGATRLIYSDGTSTAQTIADYKGGVFTAGTIAPRDSATISENPPFLSTTGASATFLHIDPTIATQVESGSANIAGITDDYDGDIRFGNPGYPGTGTAPDTGADEFNGIGLDFSPPVISYSNLSNGSAINLTRAFTPVTITDASGVNGTAGTRPRAYYRKTCGTPGVDNTVNDNTNATPGWKYVEANGSTSPFDFTIDYNLLPACGGGSGAGVVAIGDVIQYFVVAQDNAGTPNIGINSGTFAAAPTSVALTAAAFPLGGTINSYNIVASVSGTFTVCPGGGGCAYTTLTGALGAFADINGKIVTGNINLEIAGDLTTGEDGSNALNTLAMEGGPWSVKIYPTGVPLVPDAVRAITGSSATSLIRLNAADRVTIDGSAGGVGSNRDMTITNINSTTSSAVIWLQSSGADGATLNTIKNLNIVGSNTFGAAVNGTLFGIGSGASGTPGITSFGTGNNGNTYQNNNISKCQYGIYSAGASAANKNTGTAITQNAINTASPNGVVTGGILVFFDNGVQVSRNDIGNILRHDGTTGLIQTAFAIALGVVPSNTTTAFSGNEVINGTVTRNKIDGVLQLNPTGWSAMGIIVNSAASGTTLVANNMVSGVRSPSTPSDFTVGILIGGGTGSTTQVYNNSVNMTGSRASTTTNPSYAMAIATGDPIVDVRNNALVNIQTTTGTGKIYAIATGGATFVNLTSNNNDLFVAGAASFVGQTGGLGTTGTDRSNLLAWQTATGKDGASVSADPNFISASDLHINLCISPSPVNNAGVSIVAVTVDFDGDARGGTPDIGADEMAPAIVPCNDSNECTSPDTCIPSTGCSFPVLPNNSPCGDAGTECTNQDTCQSGVCQDNGIQPDGTGCGSNVDTNCDNADTCLTGVCVLNYEPNGFPCPDGLNCTTGETCDGSGTCVLIPVVCNDGSSCTNDACVEPSGSCSYVTNASCDINGTVRYYRDNIGPVEPSTKGVPNEDVSRTSTLEATSSASTNSSGDYSFLDEGGNVTLTPTQVRLMVDENECHTSITAADATQISKAAIGLVTFSTNQRIAGDTSNNGTVSSFDAALTAQKAVASPCLTYAFPVRTATGSDWAFRPVSRSYSPLTGIGEDYSFLGILYGDVTGNWTAPVLFAQSVDDKPKVPALETTLAETSIRIPTTVFESGTLGVVTAEGKRGAILYVAGAPTKNADGTWSIVFGMQNADGILGLDMTLKYDSSVIQVNGVSTTGISSAYTAAGNKGESGYAVSLFGVEALRGSGSFLRVTYTVTGSATGAPFSVAAQANEGQIPISWSGVPRTTKQPAIRVDEQ
jgi:hypothetical protein